MAATKIGFALLSNPRTPLPSTRIAALNMFPHLVEAGFHPYVVHEPTEATEQPVLPAMADQLAAEGFRIVFFQKICGPSVEGLARELTARGVKTVYGVCDVVQPGMVRATDATLVVSDFLKQQYPRELHHKLHVVHDGIENPDSCKTTWSEHRGSSGRPLRAVLVTSSAPIALPALGALPPWLELTIVGGYPRQRLGRLKQAWWTVGRLPAGRHWEGLRFLLDRRIRCVAWDPVGVYRELETADIGIIPIDTTTDSAMPAWRLKSENRLTLKMSVGLPVVATPIPSYEAVVQHGINAFLARTRDQWQDSLEALRDPQLRRDVGARAREFVSIHYSKAAQARRLVRVLRSVLEDAPAPAAAEHRP